jgi:hypothetical protein
MEGEGKSKAISKGREEASPPIAMPEPSVLFQSLLYLGGVLGAGWSGGSDRRHAYRHAVRIETYAG